MVFHTKIQLLGVLGLQVAIANLRVIKVVEGRSAEDFLVPSANSHPVECVSQRHRGRPSVQRVGSSCLHESPVGIALMKCRCCNLYAFPVSLSGKDKLLIHTLHVLEPLQVGFHNAVPDVVTRRERQPAPGHESSTKGSISVLLTVMIIDSCGVLILRILRAITEILVGVLGICLVAEPFEGLGLVARLHKEVAVPLPAHVRVLVAQTPDDAARAAAFGIVIVDVRREATPEQRSLHATIANVTVGAASHGVLIF